MIQVVNRTQKYQKCKGLIEYKISSRRPELYGEECFESAELRAVLLGLVAKSSKRCLA
jgi:hypothetical protein